MTNFDALGAAFLAGGALTDLYCSRAPYTYSVLVSDAITYDPLAPRFNSVLTACDPNRSASSIAVCAMYMATLL